MTEKLNLHGHEVEFGKNKGKAIISKFSYYRSQYLIN